MVPVISASDDALGALTGARIDATREPGVVYLLEQALGGGGMSVAFLAERQAATGSAPVVLEVMRPEPVQRTPESVALMVRKKVDALRRIGARVPPSPFVVRLIDYGTVEVQVAGLSVWLPWLAIEHVDGGAEGTTLRERVQSSLRSTRRGFDPTRAARALECLSEGLRAVHEAGIVHRDLTPDNVLCCGFDEDEVMKLADFGIARQAGGAMTVGAAATGTPGYASPEQMLEPHSVGVRSDVFTLATLVFEMLTGTRYVDAHTQEEALALIQRPERRSLLECPLLDPELRASPPACRVIDASLRQATRPTPAERPAGVREFVAPIARALLKSTGEVSTAAERIAELTRSASHTLPAGYRWTVRHRPGASFAVRSVAWDGDGTCLAATSAGLRYFNGTAWETTTLSELPAQIRFVHRTAPGCWLLGGDQATFAQYSLSDTPHLVQGPDPTVSYTRASGDPDSVLVVVAERAGEPPALEALVGGRWLEPASLPRARTIEALARVDERRWLVAGQATSDEGFVLLYTPSEMKVERIPTPAVAAYVACGAAPGSASALALVAGTAGRTVRVDARAETYVAIVEGEPMLQAAALDVLGQGWVGTSSRLWVQVPGALGFWRCVWYDPGWTQPLVGLAAQAGIVRAVSEDGGVLEGTVPALAIALAPQPDSAPRI